MKHGIVAVLAALACLVLPASAGALYRPPGVYGPQGVTYQKVEARTPPWIYVHYEYVEQLRPTLFELCRAEKEVTSTAWKFIVSDPELITNSWLPAEQGYHNSCFSG